MELFRLPVWCALGSNLSRIVLPTAVRNVVIFADRGVYTENLIRVDAVMESPLMSVVNGRATDSSLLGGRPPQ
jgi:hypothetical protein